MTTTLELEPVFASPHSGIPREAILKRRDRTMSAAQTLLSNEIGDSMLPPAAAQALREKVRRCINLIALQPRARSLFQCLNLDSESLDLVAIRVEHLIRFAAEERRRHATASTGIPEVYAWRDIVQVLQDLHRDLREQKEHYGKLLRMER